MFDGLLNAKKKKQLCQLIAEFISQNLDFPKKLQNGSFLEKKTSKNEGMKNTKI